MFVRSILNVRRIQTPHLYHIATNKRIDLGYFPQHCEDAVPVAGPKPVSAKAKDLTALVPTDIMAPFQMKDFIEGLVDEGSFLEVKKLFAGEIITGLARLNGKPVGILANQPRVKGGVLFVDSADKATRFITLCDAFGIPLVFLSDVPGFMIGSAVEKQGIIRHGAKMISAMAGCSTPRFCVVVRKAYGAGLYAMSGPGFDPDATLALPTASIAVMGAEAAVNAVFANKIAEKPEEERAAYVQQLRDEYNEDINLKKLGADLHVDAIVEPADLRGELIARLSYSCVKRKRKPNHEDRKTTKENSSRVLRPVQWGETAWSLGEQSRPALLS